MIFASCESNNMSDPEIARLIFQAESAFRSGYYNAALSIADSVISRKPDTPDIHFLRGRVLTKLSRLVDAEKAYHVVLSLDNKYQGAWFNVGTNYLRQNKIPQAIYSYFNEMEKHPSAQSMVQIGKGYSDFLILGAGTLVVTLGCWVFFEIMKRHWITRTMYGIKEIPNNKETPSKTDTFIEGN